MEGDQALENHAQLEQEQQDSGQARVVGAGFLDQDTCAQGGSNQHDEAGVSLDSEDVGASAQSPGAHGRDGLGDDGQADGRERPANGFHDLLLSRLEEVENQYAPIPMVRRQQVQLRYGQDGVAMNWMGDMTRTNFGLKTDTEGSFFMKFNGAAVGTAVYHLLQSISPFPLHGRIATLQLTMELRNAGHVDNSFICNFDGTAIGTVMLEFLGATSQMPLDQNATVSLNIHTPGDAPLRDIYSE